MSTTEEYLNYVLEYMPDGTSARKMMGEYLLYYMDRLIGGIYDNRVLLKPTNAVTKFLPDAPYELPYKGAKLMPMVEDIENKELLKQIITQMYYELPSQKPKSKKKAKT